MPQIVSGWSGLEHPRCDESLDGEERRNPRNPLEDRGNQVAYTLKFDPKKVSRQEWFETWRRNQATVRCCAVMPQVDVTAYAYQPEEAITREVYEEMMAKIRAAAVEVFDPDTSSCTMGACPL
jgi:hypothetical protein